MPDQLTEFRDSWKRREPDLYHCDVCGSDKPVITVFRYNREHQTNGLIRVLCESCWDDLNREGIVEGALRGL